MNSEEIKEIGQMFLNISNNNHSMRLGLDDQDIINGVIKSLKEESPPHFVDYQALDASEEMLSKKIATVEERRIAMEGAVKSLTSNPNTKSAEHLEERFNTAVEASKKFREEVNDKLRILHDGSWKKTDVDMQLNKLRKDYRELQDEMWNRFKLIEDWIRSDTRREKDTLKAEICENAESTLKKAAKHVLGSSATLPSNNKAEPKRYISNQYAREKWDSRDMVELDLSVRSHNSLKNGGITHIGDLIKYSPSDLIKIKNFGRKCLREVIEALRAKDLTLDMRQEAAQRKARKERLTKQFKL